MSKVKTFCAVLLFVSHQKNISKYFSFSNKATLRVAVKHMFFNVTPKFLLVLVTLPLFHQSTVENIIPIFTEADT